MDDTQRMRRNHSSAALEAADCLQEERHYRSSGLSWQGATLPAVRYPTGVREQYASVGAQATAHTPREQATVPEQVRSRLRGGQQSRCLADETDQRVLVGDKVAQQDLTIALW